METGRRGSVEHFDRCAEAYHDLAFTSPGLQVVSARDLDVVSFAARLAPGPVACDVGVGSGRVAARLLEQGFDVVGVEASAAMIEVARGRVGQLTVYRAALPGPLPFVARFADLVTAMRVLKYVDDLPAAVNELARLLTPGGVVCFDVANVRSVARFGYPEGLVHLVSYKEVLSAVEAAGLRVVAVRNGVHIPDPVWRSVRSRRAVSLVSATQRTLDVAFGRFAARSLVFVAVKTADVSDRAQTVSALLA